MQVMHSDRGHPMLRIAQPTLLRISPNSLWHYS